MGQASSRARREPQPAQSVNTARRISQPQTPTTAAEQLRRINEHELENGNGIGGARTTRGKTGTGSKRRRFSSFISRSASTFSSTNRPSSYRRDKPRPTSEFIQNVPEEYRHHRDYAPTPAAIPELAPAPAPAPGVVVSHQHQASTTPSGPSGPRALPAPSGTGNGPLEPLTTPTTPTPDPHGAATSPSTSTSAGRDRRDSRDRHDRHDRYDRRDRRRSQFELGDRDTPPLVPRRASQPAANPNLSLNLNPNVIHRTLSPFIPPSASPTGGDGSSNIEASTGPIASTVAPGTTGITGTTGTTQPAQLGGRDRPRPRPLRPTPNPNATANIVFMVTGVVSTIVTMPEHAHAHTQAPSGGANVGFGATTAETAERNNVPPTTSAVPAYSITTDASASPSSPSNSDSDSSPVDSSSPISEETEATSGSEEAAASPTSAASPADATPASTDTTARTVVPHMSPASVEVISTFLTTAASATANALLAPPASTSISAPGAGAGASTPTAPGARGSRSPASTSPSTSIGERRRSYFGFGSVRERLGLARPIAPGMPAFPRSNVGASAGLPGSPGSSGGRSPTSPSFQSPAPTTPPTLASTRPARMVALEHQIMQTMSDTLRGTVVRNPDGSLMTRHTDHAHHDVERYGPVPSDSESEGATAASGPASPALGSRSTPGLDSGSGSGPASTSPSASSPRSPGARSRFAVPSPAIPPVVEQNTARPPLPLAFERFLESVHRDLRRELLGLDVGGAPVGDAETTNANTLTSEPELSTNATGPVDPTQVPLPGNDEGLVGVEPDEEDLARELLGLPVDPARIPLPRDVEDAEPETDVLSSPNGLPAPASPSPTSPLSFTTPTQTTTPLIASRRNMTEPLTWWRVYRFEPTHRPSLELASHIAPATTATPATAANVSTASTISGNPNSNPERNAQNSDRRTSDSFMLGSPSEQGRDSSEQSDIATSNTVQPNGAATAIPATQPALPALLALPGGLLAAVNDDMVVPVVLLGLESHPAGTHAPMMEGMSPSPSPGAPSTSGATAGGSPSTSTSAAGAAASTGATGDAGVDASMPDQTRYGTEFRIYVVGGYYPPDHPFLLAVEYAELLGNLDALTEMLRRKPNVVSADQINQSALEVVTGAQLKEYQAKGKVHESFVDQCNICLEEYEPMSSCRILSCTHTFHKDCVDRWLSTGSNTCPGCRETGVRTA